MTGSSIAARESARHDDGRFGVQQRTEPDNVDLTDPVDSAAHTDQADLPTLPEPCDFDGLDGIAAAGYVTEDWKRWQQGECDVYALALVRAHPHLRFAVLGESELGGGDASDGWSQVHFFAHDDTHAYDSAGRHPLPYYGIRGDCDYVELDSDPEWYDVVHEAEDDDLEAARAHAERHDILGRDPVPYGGLTVPGAPTDLDLATGQWDRPQGTFVKSAPPLAGRREFKSKVPLTSLDWAEYGIYDPDADPDDEDADPPGPDTVRAVEDLCDLIARGERLDPIQIKPSNGASFDYDLHDGWHRIQAARVMGHDRLDAILITPEKD